MNGPLETAIEGVIKDHRLVGNHCWCDRSKRLRHHEWDAHVAAEIAKTLRGRFLDLGAGTTGDEVDFSEYYLDDDGEIE